MAKVTIPERASARQIASLLHSSDIIAYPRLFIAFARVTGNAEKLKAGTYELSPSYPLSRIVAMLARGETCSVKVTIPEGFTAQQVARRLASLGIVRYDLFLALVRERKLEGYLFPETYAWSVPISEMQVIEDLTREFDAKVTTEMRDRARQLRIPMKDIVILASIIEKEAKLSEERPLIAGVFYNRLRKRWKLESCATVLYAMGGERKELKRSDLSFESEYNTYLHYGLPPGPICNPGLDSLKAALYPRETDLMFFRTEDSRTHTFTTEFEEHLRTRK